MKTIGLVGGMSWESTVPYYRTINQVIARRLGGWHSAKILLISVDFHEIQQLQDRGDWEAAGAIMGQCGVTLQRAGADFLVLATNTLHCVVGAIEQHVSIPLLHVADATARVVRGQGVQQVGLLGTKYTMEQDFYRGRLQRRHGLTVLTPDPPEANAVHRVIYDELCVGRVLASSRVHLREVMRRLVSHGAQGIILGCTELGLLVQPSDSPVPLFDTAELHATAAARYAIGDVDADFAAPPA